VSTLDKVLLGAVLLAPINFLVFFFMSLRLGGDAVNGKIENGHYFLASHGHYTEVSGQVFAYSRWHTYSVFLTHSLMFGAAFILSRRRRGA
jgi:hypothetical protein